MNFSECLSQDEEILNKKIKSSVDLIIQRISYFPKNLNTCLLCNENFQLHNIHDLTRIYSAAFSCMKNHCTSILTLDVEDLFIFEIFLLNFFKVQEIADIQYLIKYNHNSNEIRYRQALKDQLTAIYNTFNNDAVFNINCEQEIESLTYFYRKNYFENDSNFVVDNYLLVILFLRREYLRFSHIFNITKKFSFNIKLAILFDIIEDDENEAYLKCKMLDKIEIDCITHISVLKTFLISLNGKNNFNFDEVINLFDTDIDCVTWIEGLIDRVNWQNSIKLWCTNRSDNSSYVDNSMIDVCIKNKKYDEGWLIFDNIKSIETSKFLRGITLCCVGLKSSRHCKWKKRLIEILKIIFKNNELLNIERLVESLLINIENFPVSQIIWILNELQAQLIGISLADSFFENLLGFYNIFCYEYQNSELYKICCSNAIYFYNKWNKSRSSNLNFFKKKKSEFDTKIYSHMLGLCDIAKNCEFFTKVCKDIVKNGTHMTRELCKRIETFHSKNCDNCDFRKKLIITNREHQGFMNLFK